MADTAVKRIHGPLEIQDPYKREIARQALSLLWDAMDLSRRRGLLLSDESRARIESYGNLYELVGEKLLGDDCPFNEVNT